MSHGCIGQHTINIFCFFLFFFLVFKTQLNIVFLSLISLQKEREKEYVNEL